MKFVSAPTTAKQTFALGFILVERRTFTQAAVARSVRKRRWEQSRECSGEGQSVTER